MFLNLGTVVLHEMLLSVPERMGPFILSKGLKKVIIIDDAKNFCMVKLQ